MEQFSTHTQTHTLIHRQGFSSALRGDRVVCLVLIGAIQPIQHGERDRERDREQEDGAFFVILEKLALYKILDIEKAEKKQQDMEVILLHKK